MVRVLPRRWYSMMELYTLINSFKPSSQSSVFMTPDISRENGVPLSPHPSLYDDSFSHSLRDTTPERACSIIFFTSLYLFRRKRIGSNLSIPEAVAYVYARSRLTLIEYIRNICLIWTWLVVNISRSTSSLGVTLWTIGYFGMTLHMSIEIIECFWGSMCFQMKK